MKKGLRSVYLLTTTAPGFFERFEFRVTKRDRVPTEVQQSRDILIDLSSERDRYGP